MKHLVSWGKFPPQTQIANSYGNSSLLRRSLLSTAVSFGLGKGATTTAKTAQNFPDMLRHVKKSPPPKFPIEMSCFSQNEWKRMREHIENKTNPFCALIVARVSAPLKCSNQSHSKDKQAKREFWAGYPCGHSWVICVTGSGPRNPGKNRRRVEGYLKCGRPWPQWIQLKISQTSIGLIFRP